MPIQLEDLNDPAFLSLPIEEQRKGRQQLFDQFQNDPAFKQLPLSEQRRLLKVDTAAAFKQRQAALGAKPEEIAAETGGLQAAPPPTGGTAFNIVRGVLDPLILSDPVMAIPEFVALGTAPGIARGAMAMGAFGGARAAQEAEQAGGGIGDIARAAAKGTALGGLTGALLGPAMAPRATYTAGILAPIGLGGALGFLEAPPGEGPAGAAKGAATFATMKAGGRAVSEGLGLLGRAGQATRNLFARGARAEPTTAGGAAAPTDAPAGLTDEVFGPPRPERLMLPGPAEYSARVFEEQAARDEQVRQSLRGGQLLRGQLAQQQPLEPGATTLRQPSRISGVPAIVPRETLPGEMGPIIEPPRWPAPAESAIPLGAPGERPIAGLLPEPGSAELMDQMAAKFGRAGIIRNITPEARTALEGLVTDPSVPGNVQGFARQILGRSQPEVVTPPVLEAGGPVFGEGIGRGIVIPKGKQAVADVDREFGQYIQKYLGGINPGQLREEFRSAVGKQGFRFLKTKGGTGYDEAAGQLYDAGFIDQPTVDSLQDALRRAGSGEKIYSRFRQQAVGPGIKEGGREMALAGIEQETNRTNLFQRLTEVQDPNGPEAQAILRRLKELGVNVEVPDVVHIDQVADPTLKDVLHGGMFGPGPRFSKDQVNAAEQVAAKLRPNPNPLDDLNKVNGSGAVEEVAGLEPAVPLRDFIKGIQIEPQSPEIKAQLAKLPPIPKLPPDKPFVKIVPAEVSAAPNMTAGQINKRLDQLDKLSSKLTDEFLAAGRGQERPSEYLRKNDPLSTRAREIFDEQAAIRAEIERRYGPGAPSRLPIERGKFGPTPGPRGGVDVPPVGGPGNAPTNSFGLDLQNYWDRIKSFFGIEVKNKVENVARRIMTAQELARQHPEIAPIYQAYHDYPRRAVNRHVANLTPLVEKAGPNGEPMTSYLDLPTQQRQAVDRLLHWQKENRQGQAGISDSELQLSRGFTPDMIGAWHDVLDAGKRILQAHRDDYVNSRIAALVESGVPEPMARAQLEVEAARAFQGMDHWVPDSRFGTKVAAAYDPGGNLLEFRLTPNVKQRVAAVKELQAKYPDARIDENVLDQLFKDKAFDEIDLASLGVLSKRAEVDPQVRDEFMSQLKPYLLKRSDALARYKQYQGVKGAEEDLRRPLIQASSSTFNYLERKQAYRDATQALGQIDPKQQPELFKFAEQYIADNMKPGDRGIRAVRDLAYVYALGGQLRQWPVQLTQYPTVVMPELLKFGTPAQVMDVGRTALRWSFSDLNKAPPELKEAMRQAYKEGVFQPRSEMLTGPMLQSIPGLGRLAGGLENIPFKEAQIEERLSRELGQFETPAKNFLQQARNFLMLPVSDADMRTRIGAFVSFFDLARKYRGMDPAQATRWAIDEANRTNFLYGRAESPQLFGRGNLALFMNMMKNWPAAYVSYLRGVYNEANQEAIQAGATTLAGRLGKMGQAAVSGPSAARAFASSIGALSALGGALYNIPSPLRAAWSAGLGVDPETEMRKLLSGKLGLPDIATEAVLRGVPAIAGVDVSRTFALGDVMPTGGTAADLIPALGMAQQIGTGLGQLYKSATEPFGPDVMDVAERMSGGGLKSALKAARLAQEGITTRKGGQLPGGGEVGPLQVAMQAAGFTPLQVSRAQAEQRATQMEMQRHKEIQSKMLEQLATAIHRQDNDRTQSILARIRSNNADAMARGRPDLLITVSEAQIRQHVAEMMTSKAAIKGVPQVMRRRVLELQQIYEGAGPPVPPE